MIGNLCGVSFILLPLCPWLTNGLKDSNPYSQCGTLEPGFRGKSIDPIHKFLCSPTLNFPGLLKGLMQDTHLCYA